LEKTRRTGNFLKFPHVLIQLNEALDLLVWRKSGGNYLLGSPPGPLIRRS
jgi:hypothetical protein